MSLINPSTRWWNRDKNRRLLAWVVWSVSFVLFFLTGWGAQTMDGGLIAIAFPVGMLLMLGGGFLYFLGSDSEMDFNGRVSSYPVPVLFIAQGLGYLAYALTHGQELPRMGQSFLGFGVLALLVIEAITRRVESNRVVRRKVLRSGIKTRGTVTRSRGYFLNESRVTRVTVEFTDDQGQKRWVSGSVGGTARVGKRISVQYLPEQLHRKAGVVIDGE